MSTLKDGEFAHKFYSREIRGLGDKEFPVPQGMTALLLVDEKYDHPVGSGAVKVASGLGQALKGWFDIGRDKNSLILVRASEIKLPFLVSRLLTRDPIFMDLKFNLKAKLRTGNEELFLSNLMGDRISLTLEDVKTILHSQVKDAAQGYLKKRLIQELADLFPDSLKDLEVKMEDGLKKSLEASGLSFLQIEGLDFFCEAWDERTKALANAFSRVTVKEVELKGRRQLFDLINQEDLQAIAEETEKAKNYELRTQLWERMRRAAQSDKMNEIRSETDFNNFLREMDRDKLLKETDFEEFKRNLADKLEDGDRARVQLVRMIELKNEFDYRRQENSQRHTLTAEEQAAETELEHSRTEAELKRVDLESQIRKKQEEIELARAKLDAEKDGIKLSGEEKRATSLMELEAKKEKQRLESKREEMRQQIEFYESLNRMAPEMLVMVAPDADKARIFSDLAKLKVMSGKGTEEILAMGVASGSSPQAFELLKSMISRSNSIEKEQVSERQIEEQKEFRKEMQKSHDTFILSYKDVFEKAMKTLAEVAQVRNQVPYGPPPSAYPVYPPFWPPSAPAAQLACPKCHRIIPAESNYCPYCGTKKGE